MDNVEGEAVLLPYQEVATIAHAGHLHHLGTVGPEVEIDLLKVSRG